MKKDYPEQASNDISDLFEDKLQTDIFNARCHDTGDSTTSKSILFCLKF